MLIFYWYFFISGTEPWPFYFINGFLNFNVVFILALLALPLTWLMEYLLQKINSKCLSNLLGDKKERGLSLALPSETNEQISENAAKYSAQKFTMWIIKINGDQPRFLKTIITTETNG